jgi:1,2-diacylglycerol 3-beta-galactosyltransferase
VIGFPIRTALFCTPDRSRNAPGNGAELKVLMIGGTSGAGRIYDDAMALIDSGMELDLTVVCGHNVNMYEKLCQVATGDTAKVRLHVTGYTMQIPELMRAADVLITKAGPGTLYEAAASYLPVVINSHIPGQEDDNAAFFAEAGIALVSKTSQETVQCIQTLYNDRARLCRMQNQALAAQTCQAVLKISQRILSAAQIESI